MLEINILYLIIYIEEFDDSCFCTHTYIIVYSLFVVQKTPHDTLEHWRPSFKSSAHIPPGENRTKEN